MPFLPRLRTALDVIKNHFVRVAGIGDLAFIESDRSAAQAFHRRQVVTHKQHRSPVLRNFPHLPETFLLKRSIADSENFVDEEDFRFEV